MYNAPLNKVVLRKCPLWISETDYPPALPYLIADLLEVQLQGVDICVGLNTRSHNRFVKSVEGPSPKTETLN